jgi:RHS repeat-associated protein
VTGILTAIGSTDVSINFRPAVRAMPGLDFAMCSQHGPKPSYVIEGATTVWINNLRAARKGDAVDCDAKISGGSNNVNFGSPPVPVGNKRSKEISDDERMYAGYLRMAAGIAGGSLVGGGGLPCFLGNVAVGVGMALGSSAVLGDIIPHMDYGTNAGKKAGTSIGNWLQGKPVHVPTGAKVLLGETDVLLAGAFPLIWSRFYNSTDDRIGLLGQGWSTPLSFEIVFRDDKLIFIGEQGRENIYDDLEANESRYNPAEQLKITRSAGGHYYISYPGDDLIYYFGKRATSQNGERLRVLRAMDLHDNGIDFHYNAADLVHEMVSSSGQIITLHYSEQNLSSVRLVEIKQISGGDSALPISSTLLVRYGYSASGDLISVTDRSGSVVRQFGYDNHMMVLQQFATGLQSKYQWDQLNAKGRVVKQWSDDGEAFTFEYVDEPLSASDPVDSDLPNFSRRHVKVTDQLGRTQQFTCNRHYLVERYINPVGAITFAEHDANKRLTRFTDAEGHQTSFSYDSAAQLAAVQNAVGQSATIKWHPKFARIASATHFGGAKWTYDYDELGSLVEVKGPNGIVERTVVDERGFAVAHTDAKGGRTSFSYNEQSQLTSFTDCSNKTTEYAYNRLGRLTRVTDSIGGVREFSHDIVGRLTSVQLPDGAKHQYHYDANGLLVAHTNEQGKGTSYSRNIRGEVMTQVNAAGARVTLDYDAAFRLTTLTNENHQSYQFVYDAADRLIEERRVDGTRITVEYDHNAQPIAITQHANLGDDVFTQVEIENEDAANDDTADIATAPINSIRTELIRDALGRLTEKRTPSHHYSYTYDAAGRLVEAKKLKPNASTPNAPSPLHTTRFAYDVLGNLVEETATDEATGESHTLTHVHDDLGSRIQTVLPQLAGGDAATQRALNYLYYGSGHLHQINLSQQSKASETRESIEALSANAAVYQLIADIERDDLHREILRTQGGLTSRYAYDAVSRRTGSWTRGSSLQSRAFGALPGQDSAFAQALAFPSAHEGLLKQYSYDLSGELTQRVHTQQGKVNYGYDAVGRVESAHRSTRGGQASTEQFRYDPAGNLLDRPIEQATAATAASASAGNGSYANYATQGTRRGYVHDNLVRVFEDKRYRYDCFSRLTEKRVAKHTVQRFEWDDEHHLIAVHTTRLGYAAEREGKANTNGNGTSITTQTIRFDYDAIGRRVAKNDAFGSTRFIWEGMRLIEERRNDTAGTPSGNVVTYVYEPGSYVPLARIDADGNATEAGGGGVGTTRDAAPATQEPHNTKTEQPASPREMDVSGHAVPASPLYAGYSLGHAANDDHSENTDDATSWQALQPNPSAPQKPCGTQVHLANVYYFHTDQVGLPEELSDHHGQIRWRAAYKTWGNTIAERWEAVDLAGEALSQRAENPADDNKPLAIQQNLRFQGQYLDRETNLHYNTFRFYDPDIGRFISPDPIGLNGGLNLSSYAPNPSKWIDPWGWCPTANPNPKGPLKWNGFKDRNGLSRKEHVNLHGVDDTSKPLHGVFNENPINTTQKAWAKAKSEGIQPTQDSPGGNWVYEVPMVDNSIK